VTGPAGETVAFVGLGRMGHPMARHLTQAGFSVIAADIRPDVVKAFAETFSATPARGPRDIAKAAVVITMLPSSKQVSEVLIGSDEATGLVELLAPGSLVIDCSTSEPMSTRRIGAKLASRDIAMVDAPVAGGVVFAEDGSLDALIGGAPADIERARPILKAFSKQALVCGPLGSGHAMKALNNFVNAQALLTYAEAMTVGAKFGIDMAVIVRALESATTGRNHPFEKKIVRQVLERKFASGMALSLISKDVGIARQLAGELGVWAPITDQTSNLWSEAVTAVGALADQTEVVKLWEGKAGVELRNPASKA